MADRTESLHSGTRRLTLGEFVRREPPHLRIASISQPEPEFARHNVVAATNDIDTARTAVLALEALEADDAKLGFVMLSQHEETYLVDGRADPEGVTGMVASRTLIGGALGAVAGALVIGGATALLAGGSIGIVAAMGGALIGVVCSARPGSCSPGWAAATHSGRASSHPSSRTCASFRSTLMTQMKPLMGASGWPTADG